MTPSKQSEQPPVEASPEPPPEPRPAAEAADCANEQGKFWEYHDKVFENMRNLSPELLFSFAGEKSFGLFSPVFFLRRARRCSS